MDGFRGGVPKRGPEAEGRPSGFACEGVRHPAGAVTRVPITRRLDGRFCHSSPGDGADPLRPLVTDVARQAKILPQINHTATARFRPRSSHMKGIGRRSVDQLTWLLFMSRIIHIMEGLGTGAARTPTLGISRATLITLVPFAGCWPAAAEPSQEVL